MNPRSPNQAQIYHGWLVVAAAFLIALFAWGLGFYGLGIYLVALQERHLAPKNLDRDLSFPTDWPSQVSLTIGNDKFQILGIVAKDWRAKNNSRLACHIFAPISEVDMNKKGSTAHPPTFKDGCQFY